MLGSLLLVASQDPTPAEPRSFDRTVPLAIAAANPRLESRGPSARVEYVTRFSGALHVWTANEGDLDAFLRVEDPSGRVLAEDDDSGGKPTPYVRLDVEPGRTLAIVVAASKPDGAGAVELHVVAAPETAETLRESGEIGPEIAGIRELRRAKDLDHARERAIALADRILAVAGLESSDRLAKQASELGDECDALALLAPSQNLWKAVVDHEVRSLSDGHPELQATRLKFGVALARSGDSRGALELFEKVLEVRSRTLPDEDPDLQLARFDLAAALYDSGDLRRSRELLERVVDVRARTLPDDHPDLQAARSNLALILETSGDLAGARDLQRKLLDVLARKLPDDDPNLQIARGNLAVTLEKLGELRAARELETKVLEVAVRTLPADHPDIQRARHAVASNMVLLGDLEGAREIEEAVLDALSRSLPDDHPDLLRARQGLATILRNLGDLQGARTLQEKVLEVRTRELPDDHPDLQSSRLNLASTLSDLGDVEGARRLEEKALEVLSRTLQEDDPALQRARNNLAITLRDCGEIARARALQEKVLEIATRAPHEDDPELRRARLNLAITRMVLGDFDGARELAGKVVDTLVQAGPDDHRELWEARACLAMTAAREVAAADPAARGVPEENEKARGPRGRYTEAALACARDLRRANVSAIGDASSREAEERIASREEDLGRVLSFAEGYGVFGSDARLEEEAFRASETARDAAIASARIARRAGTEPGYEKARAEARNASGDLAALAERGATTDSLAAARRRLDAAERELVHLAARAAGARTADLDPKIDDLAARIEPLDAWVAYRSFPRRWLRCGTPPQEESELTLCAFVLRRAPSSASGDTGPKASLVRVDLGPIEPIRSAVERWRAGLGIGSDPARGIGARRESAGGTSDGGDSVRRLVFDPLAKALAGSSRLVVAADDVLHLVPFDALPVGTSPAEGGPDAPERLLGDERRIELRTSLLELAREAESTFSGGGLVAVGGVDFGAAAPRPGILRGSAWEAGFGPLPATDLEARGIEALRRESSRTDASIESLAGARASRERLFGVAPRARFLHIATHGWFAPERIPSMLDAEPTAKSGGLFRRTTGEENVRGMSPMLLCGLALAGSNAPAEVDGRNPGIVTAEELSTLDLRGCELAVLSACDTNVGTRRAGQGVASLQRAMHMAGARSVVTSLWKVPDDATRELMLEFYRRIWIEKKPKAQALWEAKATLRNAKDEKGRAKYATRDWAAWVLTGDPR